MPDTSEQTSQLDAWTSTPASSRQKSTTVVLLTKGRFNETWMQRVSKEERGGRTVFLKVAGRSFRARAYAVGISTDIENGDLKMAAAVIARKFPTLRKQQIRFVTKQGPRKVKPTSTSRTLVATKILTQAGLEEEIKRRNVDTLNSLVEQLRSPLGVIPLVGAGMSAAIRFSTPPKKFLQWGELLLKIAAGRAIEPAIRALVDDGNYELAAEQLDEDRPGVLPQKITDAFHRKVSRAQLESGALSYLPFLTSGPVITTNFDRVLEQVFELANKRLEPVSGPKPDQIVSAIHQNESAILKIHGDCRDRTFGVLTVKQYDAAYGGANNGSSNSRGSIGSLAWLMFTNRPLLCLGCSLESDRTTHVLRALQQELPGLTHYAILAGHYSLSRWEKREKQLSEMGVRPLWFAPEEFKQIESLLREVLERSSTQFVAEIEHEDSNAPTPPPKPATVIRNFRALGDLIRVRPPVHNSDPVLQGVKEAVGSPGTELEFAL